MPSDFYSKFNKPKTWQELTPDELAYDPSVERPSMTKKLGVQKGAKPASVTKDSEFEYDFNLKPEELPTEVETPLPKAGFFNYLKKKGQQAVDMVQPALVDLVKKFEGLRTKAYLPTKDDVPTLGYGMTHGVKLGDTITPEQAHDMLVSHLDEYQNQVKSMVKVPLTQNQLDAVTSLVYNVGQTQFRNSRALKHLNSGDLEGFQKEAFDPEHGFVKQNGTTLTGLVNRRQQEKELFNT